MSAADDFLNDWIPLEELKRILDYGPTQMAKFLKTKALKVAKIGNNKFINRDSLNKFFEDSCGTAPLGDG